jgi:HTH-type transcriptional regulator/antitoxin HigA
MDKGERRSAEEDAVFDLMVRLIKDYEDKHHALPDPSPREMLAYLMGTRGLKQADLVPISNCRGYVLTGNAPPARRTPSNLSLFLNMSADVFI